MKKNIFDGFTPEDEKMLMGAIDNYLNMKYPNRMKSEVVSVLKREEKYIVVLENDLTTLELEMQTKYLNDYKTFIQKQKEKEELEERYFQNQIKSR